MRIAADINIPCIDIALEGLGELRSFDSRNADEVREALQGADALLCRSTIRVDDALLKNSNVRFVATATSGMEHIDVASLQDRGVTVASAAGSNARSVAEWLVSVLLKLAADDCISLEGSSIGIVGVGHVGRQVFHMANALGLTPVLNDPPRELRREIPIPGEKLRFTSLEDALACDIVTLHVPLEHGGPFPTFRMMDVEQFHLLGDGGVFINAARGDVMARDACLLYAEKGNDLVLDVYPNEPNIDPEFLRLATVATPHIAGHSYDAKLLGTQMVYDALFAWMGRAPKWRHEAHLPKIQPLKPHSFRIESPHKEVARIVHAAYDIFQDAASLYSLGFEPEQARGAYFEKLRAEYPIRREFHRTTVYSKGISEIAAEILGNLGFRLDKSR